MVSLTGSIGSGLGSTLTSLLPIAAIGLVAYLVVKNAGFIGQSIGSFAGSGLQNLTSGLSSGFGNVSNIVENIQNPANNPILVAGARLEEAATLDPNLAADRFVDPAGKYDPFSVTPIPEAYEDNPLTCITHASSMSCTNNETRTPIITRLPIIENFPTVYASPPTPQATSKTPNAPYIGAISPQPQTPQQQQDVINQNPLSYIATNNRGLNSTRSTRYG